MAPPGSYLATEIEELPGVVVGWIDMWTDDNEYDLWYSDNEIYSLYTRHVVLVLDKHRVAFWVGKHRHEKKYETLDDASGDINRWVLQGLT